MLKAADEVVVEPTEALDVPESDEEVSPEEARERHEESLRRLEGKGPEVSAVVEPKQSQEFFDAAAATPTEASFPRRSEEASSPGKA